MRVFKNKNPCKCKDNFCSDYTRVNFEKYRGIGKIKYSCLTCGEVLLVNTDEIIPENETVKMEYKELW